MTNEQLAIMLTDYKMEVGWICHYLEADNITTAKTMAVCLDARLDAILKSLNVKVYISPLG